MSDKETINVYDAQAAKYAKLVTHDAPDQDLQAFIDALPSGGYALDLGCGPGNSAAMMQAAGLRVDATDASIEMVRMARDTFNVEARQATFEEIDGTDLYDGIWANFSLLHAEKSDMPRHLKALRQALKPGGVFHIGTKLGENSARDTIGRFYSYYSEDELTDLLMKAGFRPRSIRKGAEKGLDGKLADFIIILSDG
ncbi:MAG: class I SAM-dependent methyltransferase [Pseudomonadota bacterium]